MTSPLFRFLLAGGAAAAVNWLARIAFSTFLPLPIAVITAYAIGMMFGFILYRRYVFVAQNGELARQIPAFLAVNLVGAGVVLLATILLLALLDAAFPILATVFREPVAHGLAIMLGAVTNYFGHKFLTFSTPRIPARRYEQQVVRRI